MAPLFVDSIVVSLLSSCSLIEMCSKRKWRAPGNSIRNHRHWKYVRQIEVESIIAVSVRVDCGVHTVPPAHKSKSNIIMSLALIISAQTMLE